ncbi:MAG: hypothetical protein HQ543_06645 [Bacteroidetes bacterium]|nr:hypothetical protein [Bacteroidota bacterium]
MICFKVNQKLYHEINNKWYVLQIADCPPACLNCRTAGRDDSGRPPVPVGQGRADY